MLVLYEDQEIRCGLSLAITHLEKDCPKHQPHRSGQVKVWKPPPSDRGLLPTPPPSPEFSLPMSNSSLDSDPDLDGFTLVQHKKPRPTPSRPPRRRAHRGGLKNRERRLLWASTSEHEDMDVEVALPRQFIRPRNLAPLLEEEWPTLPPPPPLASPEQLPPPPATCRPGFTPLYISSLLLGPPEEPSPPIQVNPAPIIQLDTEDEAVLAIMVDMDLDIYLESTKTPHLPHPADSLDPHPLESPKSPPGPAQATTAVP